MRIGVELEEAFGRARGVAAGLRPADAKGGSPPSC
jgi:hypothetical protein